MSLFLVLVNIGCLLLLFSFKPARKDELPNSSRIMRVNLLSVNIYQRKGCLSQDCGPDKSIDQDAGQAKETFVSSKCL
jgi:hypothetical protein